MNLIKHIVTNKAKGKYKDLGLPEELISIYLKPKIYRTLQDNIYLIHNLEYLQCFQNILKKYKEGELMYETIIKKLDFAIFDPGRIIYACNDMILNMFYIFYGTVKIDKNKKNLFSLTRRKKGRKSKTTIVHNNKFLSLIKEEKDFKKLGFAIKLMNAMKKSLIKKESDLTNKDINLNENEIILSKGDEYGFNEINSYRRKYTVETKSTCIIGFLSREDWIYIFEKTDVIKRNDMMKFLEGLQIFRNRNNDKIINNIYNSINEKKLNIGETLIKYGEELKYFYIIRKGYFQVEVKMKETIKNAFNDIDSFGNYNDKEKTENIKYEAKNFYTKEEIFKIITYGKGEFLGDIEYCLNSKKYLTKIICKSNSAIVYEISYENLAKYMTPNLNETLNKEGSQKLEYFKKRINDMKKMVANKVNNKNKYKQIILNKLEEEKGNIFKEMENKNNGLFLYEQKQRKNFKTLTFNHDLKNFYPNIDTINNNKFGNYFYKNNITENNYNNKDHKKNKFLFPSSVKKNKTNIRLFQNFGNFHKYNNSNKYFRNKDFSPTKLVSTINSSLTQNNKEKMHSYKIKSDKTVRFLNTIGNKPVNIKNIEIKNKIYSSKISNRNNLNNMGRTPKKDIMKIILSRKYIPKTPNEKILRAYCNLCLSQPNKKNSLKLSDNNDINNFRTQDYSSFNQNDKSINESLTKTNTIFALKTKRNKINLKKNIPLLTEFVNNKKDLTLRGFSLRKQNNFNVNYE